MLSARARVWATLFTLVVATGSSVAQQPDDKGWINLVQSEKLEGWRNPFDWGKAELVNGEVQLTADKKFFLVSDREYSDFVFEGEILLPAGQANSGFMVRAHVEPNKVYGYQAEVDGSDRRWSGGLYDEGRRQWLWPSQSGRTTDKKALEHEEDSKRFFQQPEIRDALKRNDWNHYRMTCVGPNLKFEVNGVVTTEYEDTMDAKGYIGIQHHGEKGQTYRFRNLRIKELK
jgi:hypothetical protein